MKYSKPFLLISINFYLFLLSPFLFLPSQVDAAGAVQRKQQQQQAFQQQIQEQMIARELAKRQQAIQQIQLQRQQQLQQLQIQQVQQQIQQRAIQQVQQQVVAQAVAQRQQAMVAQAVRIRQEQIAQAAAAQMQLIRRRAMENAQRAAYRKARSVASGSYNPQIYSAIKRRAYQTVNTKRYIAEKNIYQLQQMKAARDAVAYRDYQNMKNYQAQKTVGEYGARKAYQEAGLVAGANAAKMYGVGEEVAEVVDMSEVWKSLDESMEAWPLIIDTRVKVQTVVEYIERFNKQKVYIRKDPMTYVEMIDNMVLHNPAVLSQPLNSVLRVAAVMEYDFDNGMNKDKLARKLLDKDQFERNKKRLGK